MALDRPIQEAKETASQTLSKVRSRLSILEDKKRCEECSTPMQAGYAYSSQEAAFFSETNGKRPSWYCPNCEQHYIREEHSVTVDPYR